MRPEEYLDRLIEQRENGASQPLLLDDEVATSLAAAERLVQMRKVQVSAEFALRLEGDVRAHVRMQRSSEQSGRLIPFAPSQRYQQPRRSLKRRSWVVAVGSVAILLIIFASLLTVSAQSLPGDPLYGLKQTEDQITLTWANSAQSRANEAIGQLQSSLVDLNTVVNGGRDDNAIQQALNAVATWTSKSQAAVAAIPAGSQFRATQQHLAEKLADEKQTLYHLLNQVDWPMKVAFTQQLGKLGEAVPTVTRVMVQTQSNGVLGITLSGSNFAFQVQLVIDGKRIGTISQSTASSLVAVVNNIWWISGTHSIGVLNADGTAAQIVYRSNEDGYEQSGTPTATPTNRSHKDD